MTQLQAAIEEKLSGQTPAERNGKIQRGFDFARFVAGITDPLVVLHSTWLDTSPSWGKSPLEFLSTLADLHPLDLKLSGENTGGGGEDVMRLCAERIERHQAIAFLWAFQSDLMNGKSAGLPALSRAFSLDSEL